MANNLKLYEDGYIITYPEGDISLERISNDKPVDLNDKVHIVVEGDTLLLLAHYYYQDSSQWYKIAESNKLDDIFNLNLGMELVIPNLENYV